MIFRQKKILIITSLLILLPIVSGLLLWNQLPDTIATHWGPNGEPDGWSSKGFAVFAIPLFLLAIHYLGIWITYTDKRNKNQSTKVVNLVFWICPVISFLVGAIIFSTARGVSLNMTAVPCCLLSVLFIVIGNYLPKCKHNHTIGIKLPWTLANEENWYVTHRLAGKVWVIGGVAILPLMFLPAEYAFLVMMLVMAVLVLVPTVYSYLYARRHG